jgi:hypothetical protein
MEKFKIKYWGIAWILAGVLAVGPVLQAAQAQQVFGPDQYSTVGLNTNRCGEGKCGASPGSSSTGGNYTDNVVKPQGFSDGGSGSDKKDKKKKNGGGGSSVLPAVLVGVAALIVVSQLLAKESEQPEATPDEQGDTAPDLLDRLSRQGPELATAFNMSAFIIRGPVKGGWPLVIDYEHGGSGQVQLQVSARGASHVYNYPLPPLGAGRHIIQLKLHPDLGPQLRPAVIALTARAGEQTLPGFRVYGLGVGPEAVGSVAIDQLQFRPPSIRVSHDETAAYRFHSGSDFDSIAIEFLQLEQAGDGSRHSFVDRQFLEEGVRQDHWVGLNESRVWDGRDKSDKTSVGTHRLQVRAWDADGDWVCAWSEPVVAVAD